MYCWRRGTVQCQIRRIALSVIFAYDQHWQLGRKDKKTCLLCRLENSLCLHLNRTTKTKRSRILLSVATRWSSPTTTLSTSTAASRTTSASATTGARPTKVIWTLLKFLLSLSLVYTSSCRHSRISLTQLLSLCPSLSLCLARTHTLWHSGTLTISISF